MAATATIIVAGATFASQKADAHRVCKQYGDVHQCSYTNHSHTVKRTYKIWVRNRTGMTLRYRHEGTNYRLSPNHYRIHYVKINSRSGNSYKNERFYYDCSLRPGYQSCYVTGNKADTYSSLIFTRRGNYLKATWLTPRRRY